VSIIRRAGMTSLYGVVRGKPPKFFDGNAQAFAGLRFHLGTETFALYQPLKMQDDPLWIDVTSLMQAGTAGLGTFVTQLSGEPAHAVNVGLYVGRLSKPELCAGVGGCSVTAWIQVGFSRQTQTRPESDAHPPWLTLHFLCPVCHRSAASRWMSVLMGACCPRMEACLCSARSRSACVWRTVWPAA